MKIRNLLLASALLATASTAALAGQGWHVRINNQTDSVLMVSNTQWTTNCWYKNDFSTPQLIAPKSQKRIYVEEKNSGYWCWGSGKTMSFEIKPIKHPHRAARFELSQRNSLGCYVTNKTHNRVIHSPNYCSPHNTTQNVKINVTSRGKVTFFGHNFGTIYSYPFHWGQ